MKTVKWLAVVMLSALLNKTGYSQQLRLGNNPYTVEKSAVLELQSENQGLLFPRIADTALINLLNPPDGMVIFFTPVKQLLLRSNGHWNTLTPGSSLTDYWSLIGNTTGAVKKIGSIDNYGLSFITNNTERVYIADNGDVGIGTGVFDATNPEKLLVDAGATSSFNVISGKGTINNYLQLNIQNRSNGNTASSDLVATADNGTESANFVDLGINSSAFSNVSMPILNGANNAYLYSTGNDFIIGNGIAAKNLRFFTGGYATANERLRIDGNGRIGVGVTAPTAILHLKAGTTAANTAPLKFTSGSLMTTAQAGAIEFLTDKFYGTIATGAARKEFTLNDAALTAGGVPVITTNGRLTSNANFVWNNTNSRLGIMETTPTAYLHLGAGTAAANTAPLKLTAGVHLTSPETGAVEFDGTHFYGTIGSTRYQLDQQAGTTYTASNGITLTRNDFSNSLITGLAGGQTITGGTDGGNALTITSTGHATKGKILFGTSAYDEANNRLGIGNNTPDEALDLTGNFKFSGALMPGNNAGTSGYLLRSNGAGTAPSWTSLSLSDLADISISSPASGQLLQYNGSAWVNFSPNYLTSVDTSNISNFYLKVRNLFSAGSGITYNAGTGVISSTVTTSNLWALDGNTVGTVKSLGTIDNIELPFKTNNTERMRIDNAGKVGIGTTSIAAHFHVKSPITTGPVAVALFEGVQGAGAGNYSYIQIANSSATNSKSALVMGGATAANQWLLGTDAFGNKAQNFYIYDASTASTRMFIDGSGNIGVGNYTFHPTNPEKFVVDAGNTSSYNVISGKGTIDNYLQLNIQNKSNGATASSDLVATADNGTETANFVDLGINSSGYASSGILGGVNNAYLYSTGNDFMIGNATANKNLLFFTGGTTASNERMRIDGTGKIGIATTSPGNFLEVGGTNITTGVSGLRLTNLGTATTATTNTKLLSVNSNGDVIVTNNPASTNWLYTGNSGTNPAVNFLGTTDDKQMILKSNGQSYLEFGRRQTLGLTQAYPEYDDNDERITYIRSALQFEAPAASFYKPKMYTDINGNFRVKGSSAGTDFFEFGSTGSNNDGGFEFIIGDDGDEPILFKSYHYINGMSEIMRLQSGRMAVGSNAFDATNPEKLLIDAGVTNSYNLMTGKGSIDNYLQINVQNRSAGGSASSDMVATSNNGSESTNYIDMGINGGSYTNNSLPMLAGANTAYLYSTGTDFVLGNGTASRNMRFFTGGFATTNERMRIDGNGNVGIGATAFDASNPEQLLVDAGTTSSFNVISGKGSINNYLQLNIQNRSNGTSASSDIVATADNGTESVNFVDLGINSSTYPATGVLGGANNAYLYSTGNDFVIGNSIASKNLRFFTGGTATTNERMRIDGSGNVGIGTTSPTVPLAVEESGGTVASFNRTSSDGTIISFRQAGSEEGTISVIGSFVSYNAFSGSHYGHTSQSIEKGMLVTLTGQNQFFHNNKNSEIIYGMEQTAIPNDPKVMGSYLGLQEGGKPFSVDNPHLIMAVGNGMMWVADKGENLSIGDYLISSDIAGHAMKENGSYPTAYVIARVAEPVEWKNETTMINGVKHKLVSVLFESFVKNNAQKELENIKLELKALMERVKQLESKQ